jgi:CBS domain containing-hemolysin-like protein
VNWNFDEAILIALKILAVLTLVLLNGFFVAAELVRIRDTQLASLALKGNRRAKTARHIVAHIDTYIGATQFGITLASLGLGVAVEPVFRSLLEPLFDMLGVASEHLRHNVAIGVGFFVNCYLLIVACPRLSRCGVHCQSRCGRLAPSSGLTDCRFHSSGCCTARRN